MIPRVGSLWRYKDWGIVYIVSFAFECGPFRLDSYDKLAVSFLRENLAELLSDFEPLSTGPDLLAWREEINP